MPDVTPPLYPKPNVPPPSGDSNQAEKYVSQLIGLIDSDKLEVTHTDLGKFDPSALQDHYSLELKEYKVEISHSKHPTSGRDSYVMLFTNIKNHCQGLTPEKIILAYMHLDENQFNLFKKSYHLQSERKRRAEEERRLKEALNPIDQALSEIGSPTPSFAAQS